MLKNIDVEAVFKCALAGGGEFAEIFAEHTVTTAIAHEDKKLERMVEGIDSGFGIRVIRDGQTFYGYTNDANEIITVASSLGGRSDVISAEAKTNKTLSPSHSKQDNVKNIELVRTAASKAWGMGDNIVQVQVNFRDTTRKIWLANSKGLNISDVKNDRIMAVIVIASKDGIIQTGMEPAFGDFDPEKLAGEAARRALSMLTAKHAPSGVMPVVISSSAGGTMIHEAVGHGLEADLAGQGLSVYQDKIGEQVASTLVTVLDDGTMMGKRGTFKFDDEGNHSQRTVLIKEGILNNYLHSLVTSRKMGTSPTGNGRRESYRNRPIPRMTNTMVAPGKDDPEKIVSSVSKGLLVKRMGGGQVNTVNGDFVFEAQEAYLIENGKVSEPVRGATLIGNGPKVLMDIDMVGNDIGYGIGTCGKEGQGVPVSHGMPTIRIPSITVGGSA